MLPRADGHTVRDPKEKLIGLISGWRFRNHKEKLTSVHLFEDMALQPDLPDFSAIQKQVSMLDKGKMAALYSDLMREEVAWAAYKPKDLITEELARNALTWAQNRIKLYDFAVLPLLEEAFSVAGFEELAEKLSRNGKRSHAALLLKSIREMQSYRRLTNSVI